ncbi:amidohydrolase family protein [Synoicihabitans lomoniglobus]|uniref:Amidohydrolase family protein n=1 Tax=Synoicihabitans lomoniglobus TaxID=2909285 RepID=A0AAF0I4S1_9BACT|nr:amidohydrolase family protein [Opitutaceae bacterium LMO-M01]WED66988.1 amidohydrolase family protein [Opitutaceae bacterium LMO-M01]
MKIIDFHTHPIFFGEGTKPGETAAKVKRARALGIERMVALGDVLRYGRVPDATQSRTLNDEMAMVAQRDSDFWIPLCGLNPLLGEKLVREEVDRCVGGMGFRGLKLEISCNARDAAMKPVMEAARHYGVPVLQHSWSQTNIKERRFHSDPEDTAELARRWPDVTVIMAHLTGCGYRGVRAARGLDNLFIDTSGAAPEAGLVEYAVEEIGAHRVLYGSDAPIRDLPVAIGRITGAAITARAKRALLFENANQLLAKGGRV